MSYLPRETGFAFGEIVNYGDIELRDFVENLKSKKIYFVGRNKIYEAFSGNSFDGQPRIMNYLVSAKDFGRPGRMKKIGRYRGYIKSELGTNVYVYHQTDEDQGRGVVTLPVEANPLARYDIDNWDVKKYGPVAGELLQKVETDEMQDSEGKLFKFLIRHNSSDTEAEEGFASFQLSRLEMDYSEWTSETGY